MMLKSNTDGNYGVSYKVKTGSELVFKPPKSGTYPLQLFCGESAKSLSLSASFFVTCEGEETEVSPFPERVLSQAKYLNKTYNFLCKKLKIFAFSDFNEIFFIVSQNSN